jgi:hypothetical protein
VKKFTSRLRGNVSPGRRVSSMAQDRPGPHIKMRHDRVRHNLNRHLNYALAAACLASAT